MKHLTPNQIVRIVEMLGAWRGKLTWTSLLQTIRPSMGHYTRQALSTHAAIQLAYTERKRLLGDKRNRAGMSVELQAALDSIDRLKTELENLRRINGELVEKFVRWSYNAHCKNISEEFLDRPMYPVDRSQTDETKLSINRLPTEGRKPR